MKRILMSAVGMLLVLGFWTITGKRTKGGSKEAEAIPRKVLSGGTDVTLDVEISAPGRVVTHFAKQGDKSVDAYQKVAAGHHTFVISVPPGMSGTAEVNFDNPPVGTKAHIEVRGSGHSAQDDDELANALEPGHAFFVQLELDDWATAKVEGANNDDDRQ